MKTVISLLAGVALTCTVLSALAQRPAAPGNDPAPWHRFNVNRYDTARGGTEAATNVGPQKYLHVDVRFNVSPESRKKHRFRYLFLGQLTARTTLARLFRLRTC